MAMRLSWQVISLGVIQLVLLQSLCHRAGACTSEEREALLSFLAELSPRPGDSFTASWRGSADCYTWHGVSCGGDGAVTRLWLPSRGLDGTFSSPAVANLTALKNFNLSRNSLDGAFPPALLSLSVVDVSNNRLSGALPDLPPPAAGARRVEQPSGGAVPVLSLGEHAEPRVAQRQQQQLPRFDPVLLRDLPGACRLRPVDEHVRRRRPSGVRQLLAAASFQSRPQQPRRRAPRRPLRREAAGAASASGEPDNRCRST
jgi:hypothetical protein